MKLGLSRFINNDDFRPAPKKEPTQAKAGKLAAAGAVGGAAVGAVLGGGVGYLQRLENLANPEAQVSDQVYFSQRPDLVGAYYDDSDMLSRYNPTTESTEFYWTDDDWDPVIDYHDDKPYQKPVFQTEQAGTLKSVAGGAIKGAVIGGVVGAAGVSLARLAGFDKIQPQRVLDDSALAMVAGGAAGAIVGGAAGFHAGAVAQRNALVEVRTAPTYERQQIGWMPYERNASSIARDLGKGSGNYRLNYSELGDRYGKVPFEGQVRVRANVQVGEHQQEFRSSSLTPWKGALTGTLVGGALGVAVGAAASLANRLLAD